MSDAPESSPPCGTWPRGFPRECEFAWPLVRAEQLVTLNYGKALLEKNRQVGSVPVFGTNGQCGWHNKALANAPGLILGRKGMGNLGVEWSPTDFWVIDTAYYVTPNRTDLDLKFFYYLASYVGLNHLKDGTSNPSLSRDTFYAQLLPHPPVHIQRAIAYVLGTLDDKIELNRRMNRTLEGLARALFRSWFVDFDPVRAKADGRAPAGMDAATAALFPDHFEDSELGKIPAGWRVGRIGDVTDINPSLLGRTFPHDVIDYIDISSVRENRLEGVTPYLLADAPSRAKRLVAHGDIIWSCVRPNHRAYLFIHRPAENLVVSTGFAVLRPKGVVPSYLYGWTSTNDFVDYLTANADGSAYPAVRPLHFEQALILQPGASILQRYEMIVGPILEKVATNAQQSSTLAALRDALLPKLISGELRVPDAERAVEEVA